MSEETKLKGTTYSGGIGPCCPDRDCDCQRVENCKRDLQALLCAHPRFVKEALACVDFHFGGKRP